MGRSFSLADHEECVRNTAKLVVRFGDAAIPLLERAEAELLAAQSREDAIARAHAILRAA